MEEFVKNGMKQKLFFILVFLSGLSFGQVKYSAVFDDVLVRDIKPIENHYLLHLDHLMHDELREYIINCDEKYCMEGLAFMNASFQYEWIFVPEKGGIADFWEDADYIYILNTQRSGSKIDSKARLFLLKLDRNGQLLSSEKIDEVAFDRPNGRFDARFDENGLIWKITDIPRSTRGNYSQYRPGSPGKSYILEALTLNLEKKATYAIDGKYLNFEAFDSGVGESSFVFSADSVIINGELLQEMDKGMGDIPSVLLLRFNSDGELTSPKYIGYGSCWVKEIEYDGANLIIGGSYRGNSVASELLPDCYFQGTQLRSPRSYIGSDLARNSFIASLDSDLNLNWLNKISGSCDILFNSLSASNGRIAVSFNYKDSVLVSGHKIHSLREKNRYQYADPVVCYFNEKGNFVSYEQLACNSSSWNKVFLFSDYTFVHGTFLYNINTYGNELKSESKNSVYYLTVIKNAKARMKI